MTPAQQVALDGLREAFDEATVRRMMRAAESQEVEVVVVALAFLLEGAIPGNGVLPAVDCPAVAFRPEMVAAVRRLADRITAPQDGTAQAAPRRASEGT